MSSPLILVVSQEESLAQTRRHVLESAGYRVVSAMSLSQVVEACNEHKFDLVVVGHSVPGKQKRQIWETIRTDCRSPVVELYRVGPDLADIAHSVCAHDGPEALIAKVGELVNKGGKSN